MNRKYNFSHFFNSVQTECFFLEFTELRSQVSSLVFQLVFSPDCPSDWSAVSVRILLVPGDLWADCLGLVQLQAFAGVLYRSGCLIGVQYQLDSHPTTSLSTTKAALSLLGSSLPMRMCFRMFLTSRISLLTTRLCSKY